MNKFNLANFVNGRRAAKFHHFFLILLTLLFSLMQPLAVLACATCGCSELCPLSMVKGDEEQKVDQLSESLWGNIILKMAYKRDPEMQKLTKHMRGANNFTSGAVASTVGLTFAQNIVSEYTVNPPPGYQDTYLPGALGLAASGLVNVVFDGSLLINWRLKKKIHDRQELIRKRVEAILSHLEFSQTSCPEAQVELTSIIGGRAASDCIQLWRSSHAIATATANKNLSILPDEKNTL